MLTNQDITIIKKTIPLLESAGPALTAHFYQRMFKHNPELKNIFNMSHQKTGRQGVALFEAIAAYAKNIEDPSSLQAAIERIAHKHTSFNIQSAHYQIVGTHLIETLRELTKSAFTSEVEHAWTNAYQFLANIFIKRENELYLQRAAETGGWRGARPFKIIDKTVESDLVTSFTLAPIDEGLVINYKVGQYIGIEVKPTGSEHTEIRQYSLSDKPNGHTYRISVKREEKPIQGLVSNYLHKDITVGDEVKLHAPAGDFYFKTSQRPVALISAGVGVTPMMAMLEQLATQNYSFPVNYLHACENKHQHTFKNRVQTLCKDKNWHHHTWYNTKDINDNKHIQAGLIDFKSLELPLDEGDFYICGPVGFMAYAKKALQDLGVPNERLHYEVFGPHETL